MYSGAGLAVVGLPVGPRDGTADGADDKGAAVGGAVGGGFCIIRNVSAVAKRRGAHPSSPTSGSSVARITYTTLVADDGHGEPSPSSTTGSVTSTESPRPSPARVGLAADDPTSPLTVAPAKTVSSASATPPSPSESIWCRLKPTRQTRSRFTESARLVIRSVNSCCTPAVLTSRTAGSTKAMSSSSAAVDAHAHGRGTSAQLSWLVDMHQGCAWLLGSPVMSNAVVHAS